MRGQARRRTMLRAWGRERACLQGSPVQTIFFAGATTGRMRGECGRAAACGNTRFPRESAETARGVAARIRVRFSPPRPGSFSAVAARFGGEQAARGCGRRCGSRRRALPSGRRLADGARLPSASARRAGGGCHRPPGAVPGRGCRWARAPSPARAAPVAVGLARGARGARPPGWAGRVRRLRGRAARGAAAGLRPWPLRPPRLQRFALVVGVVRGLATGAGHEVLCHRAVDAALDRRSIAVNSLISSLSTSEIALPGARAAVRPMRYVVLGTLGARSSPPGAAGRCPGRARRCRWPPAPAASRP